MESSERTAGLASLASLALLTGAVAGLVGAGFRVALVYADHLRYELVRWAWTWPEIGWIGVIAVPAGLTAAAAWMVRRYSPHASGSGIPHVEAVLRGDIPQAPWPLIPVKFVGGLLAIGSGLALGREGPSVQMGATLAHLTGRLFRCRLDDCLALLAAGAGAGLATAFNAPIGGAVFVLEELVRRFETRVTVATFASSAAAIAVSRMILGDAPDFAVPEFARFETSALAAAFILGVAAGLVGVAYNRAIVGANALADAFARVPVEVRAACVGGLIGAIAWFVPDLVGGGDPITQHTLTGNIALPVLAIALVGRFVLGPVSYAAKTPGGLFAPLLVVGAQGGLLFGMGWSMVVPDIADPRAFAVVGMAAFFTAVVRAPITGIVLVTEMTGNFSLLLPMLCANATAMLIPTMLQNPPIYDSLREPDGK